MPLPFLPGYDQSLVPSHDDLLVAATVDGRVAVLRDGSLPSIGMLPEVAVRHIGALRGRPVWAGLLTALPEGIGLRWWTELTAELPEVLGAVVARGYYQVRWRHTNRHCGECGGELEDYPGFTTRRCPRCTTLRYVPNSLSPAVLVAAEHDDRLLLVRQTYGPHRHRWELVAGVVAAGETLEDAAVRELWEETGLMPSRLAYAGSHAWSIADPAVMLAGFTAAVVDPTLRLDPGEIAEAKWFGRAELRALAPAELTTFAYTLSLIHRFLDGRLD